VGTPIKKMRGGESMQRADKNVIRRLEDERHTAMLVRGASCSCSFNGVHLGWSVRAKQQKKTKEKRKCGYKILAENKREDTADLETMALKLLISTVRVR
jgi:hypothetical protein